MPDNQSNEKYQMIETLGAEVLRVKTVPYCDPNHYQKVAARLADEIPGAIWANQFDNTANRDAHEQTTGPEIWAADRRPASTRSSPRPAPAARSAASRAS